MERTEKEIQTIKRKIEYRIEKLRRLSRQWLQRGDKEKALRSLMALAKVEYFYNQQYTDDLIEQAITGLAEKQGIDQEAEASETVLFYDGFDYQHKGLIQIYLKALATSGYRIIYISDAEEPEESSPVKRILEKTKYQIRTTKGQNSLTDRLQYLRSILREEKYGTAFFYTKPWDITGAIAFREIEGKANRYLINLTDHAFWIGQSSVDYVIEFRDYGASISHEFRGFDLKQLLKLPFYPIINREASFEGFPKGTEGKRVVFSGGSLYKTIDRAGTYYRIVEKILNDNPDVVFIYAGSGDDRLLKKLAEKIPGRVFHLAEREDLFEVMRHSVLYLNTYPISGGLMPQYAAEAGCIPVTFRRPWDDDAVGLLRHEEKLGESFTDEETLLAEIQKLLNDEEYRQQKRQALVGQVITEEEFTEELRRIIQEPASPYTEKNLQPYDTQPFREAYLESINPEDIHSAIINHETTFLIPFFPKDFIAVIRKKIKEKR